MKFVPRRYNISSRMRVSVAAFCAAAVVLGGVQMPQAVAAGEAQPEPRMDTPRVGEVTDKDEFSTTTFVGDGVYETEIQPEPSNVLDSSGDWVPASNELTSQSDGSLIAEGHPMEPSLAPQASEADSLSVDDGLYTLGFTLLGADDSSYSDAVTAADPARAVYPEVFSNVDLQYELTTSSIKETLILQEQPSASASSWTWIARAPGLALLKNEIGQLNFVDRRGVIRFHIPAPIMWDSSGQSGVREPAEKMLGTTISSLDGDRWRIRVSADAAWLNDPSRQYPVYIDPTTSLGDSNVVSYKSDGATRTDYVHVGNTRESNLNRFWRAQVKYDYTSLYGKQILDANVYATYVSGTTSARTGSVNTADCRGYDCVATRLAYLPVDSDGTASTDSLSTRISDWVNAKDLHSLIIRGSEAAEYTYKALNTTLKVSWKEYPKILGQIAPSPAAGGDTTRTPSLNVSYSAPTGYSTSLRYIVGASANPETDPVFISDWAAPAQGSVPSGILVSNQTYFWKAQIRDTKDGLWGTSTVVDSSVWSFVARNTGPEVPELGAVTPSSGSLPIVAGPTPKWIATASDPDEDPVRLEFEVRPVATDGTYGEVESLCVTEFAPSDDTLKCNNSEPLPTGVPLAVRLRASDDLVASAWSQWTPFTASATVPEEPEPSVQKELPFNAPITLQDAVAETDGRTDVVGYRFESVDMVGEWYPTAGESPATFLTEYQADYGTQPEVVAAIVTSDSDSLPELPIDTAAAVYSAPVAMGPEIQDFNAALDADAQVQASQNSGTATGASTSYDPIYWDPDYAKTEVQRNKLNGANSTQFTSYYKWNGLKTAPTKVDANFGLEFENNVWANNYDKGYIRCDGPRIPPHWCNKTCEDLLSATQNVAKNTGWSWRVYMGAVGTASESKAAIKKLRAYKDTNDLYDDCDRNSITIGIMNPRSITESSNGEYRLYINVNAPKGSESTAIVSGGIQAVERISCQKMDAADRPAAELTDCMGTLNTAWTGPGEPWRPTLGKKRKWYAPNLCWESKSYGLTDPVAFSCGNLKPW